MKKKDYVGYKEYYPPPPPGGFPKFGYVREMPLSLLGRVVEANELTQQLPVNLELAGYELFSLKPLFSQTADPVVLYNPWGEIVAEWEVMPSWGELLRVCKEVWGGNKV